jgi:HK97 family phage prohead protease
MPYGISATQPDCSTWATVKSYGNITETITCHTTKQDAIDQMVALSLAENLEPLGEVRIGGAEEVLIVDIDDTLLQNGVQPIQKVIDYVNNDYPEYLVVIVTGRLETDREATVAALLDAGVQYDRLIMKQDEALDNAEYKKSVAEELIADGKTIDKAIDNDSAARDAYTQLGIKVVDPYELDMADEPTENSLRAINLKPPAFMRENAKRGLRLHEEGFSGDGLQPQTVEDARKMVSGVVTEQKWRKIGAWIARHMGDLDAVEGDEITAGLVAMLLWGGGSTKSEAKRTMDYAYGIVERLDAMETNSRSKYDWQIMTDTMQWVATDINEKRSIAYSNLELRAESDGNTIVGYAAIWDSPSEPMPFIEYVKRGAFSKTLNDGADVRLLVDHEGVPLARTKSGTMTLIEDERGLRMEAKLDPMNPDAARIISAMKRGDLSQMSFAFRTVKDNWNSDRSVRELREVQLFDVSVVTFPAYEETVAELRSKNVCVTVPVTTGVLLRKQQIALQKYRSR